MAVTIKEIAARTRVSTASVSRALNGLPGVGSATRAQILLAAQQLGYTPDSRAQALVTGRVPFLGLVLADITNPFFPEVARGAEDALAGSGYSLLLINTDWRPERLREAFELLTSRRVGGLLVAVPLDGAVRELGLSYEALAGRVVMVGQRPPRASGLGSVEVDDAHGGYLAGAHLLRRGWRRLAFLSGPAEHRSTRGRLAGLRRALAQAGAEERLAVVSYGRWSVASGHEQASAALAAPGAVDAIFAANDQLALGAARAAREAGLRLGQDLGLLGYDDIEAVRFLDVPLTTVGQPKAEMARQAARMLLGQLEQGEPATQRRLRPELVVRHSCGEA